MSNSREKLNAKAATSGAANACAARVLLVEDEPSVRLLVTRYLTLHGFDVTAAESPVRANELWNQRRGRFDLLLTDVMMPGELSGRSLAEQFHSENPVLKVLFTSGYSCEMLSANGALADGEVNFLQKPYRPEQLLETVRAVLAGTINAQTQILC